MPERKKKKKCVTSQQEERGNTSQSGVLSGQEAWDLGIIKNGDKRCLKIASYDLRFGKEVFFCGEEDADIKKLEKGQSISIDPFGMIIFSTEEVINLQAQQDIIGRFDLKIGYGLEGLIVQVGTQIEPGYKGPLFGFLINTMGSQRTLEQGKDFLTVEFSRVTFSSAQKRQEAYADFYSEKTIKDMDDFLKDQAISRDELKKASIVKVIHEEIETCRRDHGLADKEQERRIRRRRGLWGIFLTIVVILLMAGIFLAERYCPRTEGPQGEPRPTSSPQNGDGEGTGGASTFDPEVFLPRTDYLEHR